MRVITFDIETSDWFGEIGSSDPADLTIALVGVHDSETNQYTSYLVPELPALWKILEHADVVVGYNSDHFDIPLLNKYYPGNLSHIKSIDLMVEIHKRLGRRLKLDAVAEGTLGMRKSGKGLEATTWWKQGEIEKVRSYCLKDVELTRKIFDYALAHNSIKYRDLGGVREIKLDTSDWMSHASRAMTHTLGL